MENNKIEVDEEKLYAALAGMILKDASFEAIKAKVVSRYIRDELDKEKTDYKKMLFEEAQKQLAKEITKNVDSKFTLYAVIDKEVDKLLTQGVVNHFSPTGEQISWVQYYVRKQVNEMISGVIKWNSKAILKRITDSITAAMSKIDNLSIPIKFDHD